MKKLFILLVAMLIIGGSASANILKKQSDVFVSSDYLIKNVSILVANTSYEVNFSGGGIASYNLHARGGDIKLTKSGTTTEAGFTIDQGSTLWDHMPMLFAPNTKMYAFATTVPCTLEMFYTYY